MLKYKFFSSVNVFSYRFTSSSITLWEFKSHVISCHFIANDSILLFYENNTLLSEDSSLYKNSFITLKRVPSFLVEEKVERKSKPPVDYICFRCGMVGHFIQDCPTNNDSNYDYSKITKPSGIPKDFLEEITEKKDDDGMMVTDTGVCVAAVPRTEDWVNKTENFDVDENFYCTYCHKIMKFVVKIECGCLYCFKCRPSKCCEDFVNYEPMYEMNEKINNFIQNRQM